MDKSTETIAVASPDFEDTVGDGVMLIDESTPSSTPDTSGQELTPTDESVTETSQIPGEEGIPSETQSLEETQPVDGTQSIEVTQSPEPEQTDEVTITPEGTEGEADPSATPSPSPEATEPTETEPAATEQSVVVEETSTPEDSGDRGGGGGSGAIWTTDSSCAPQDLNHYSLGQAIWIRAAGFTPNKEYSWFINETGPGHPTVVSGTQTTNSAGYVCFYAYTFTSSDTINNPYQAKFSNKNDNFSVEIPTAEPKDNPLALSYQCQYDGNHLWTVSNSNNYAIGFSWNSTSGEFGNGSVPANGSTTFTTNNNSQTVTVNYSFNRTVSGESVSVSADACIQAIDLELNYECTENGDHLWTVSNSNDFALDFTWNSTTGDFGSGQVAANGTATFETGNEAQTVTVYYEFPTTVRTVNPNQKSVSVYAEECKVQQNIELALDYECQSDTTHLWTVTNNNNFAIEYSWSSNKNGQHGNGTVPANGTATFTTNNKAQTVTISYKFPENDRCGGGCVDPKIITLSVYAEECKIENKDLQLNYECEDDGDHLWTVTNYNSFAIQYEWTSTIGGQHGQGTVPANGTDTFTTNDAAQTVVVNWSFPDGDRCGTGRCSPELYSVSVDAEVCKIEMKNLDLSVECMPDGQHKWTVSNSNNFPVYFEWTSTDGSNGSGTVSANKSSFFLSSFAAQSVTITWDDNGDQKSNTKEDEACQVPLEKLQLSVVCLDTGNHEWTVTNPNSQAIDFSWSSTSGEEGTGSAPANGSTTFLTSIKAQNVTITYLLNGGQVTKTKHGDKCDAPDLDLSFVCGYGDEEVFTWKVTNSNSFAVNFTWSVAGSSESGSGSVPANSDVTFTTSTGNKKVSLYVMNFKVDQEWNSGPCLFDLKLSYDCLPDGTHTWTVTNDNSFAQSFTWSSTSGESGSDSVSANSSTTISTDKTEQTITVTYSHSPFPQRSVSLEADACKVDTNDLRLEYSCLEDGSHHWTVYNDNDFSKAFNWSSTSGEFGSDTVPANGSVSFNSNHSAQTMTVSYSQQGEVKSVSLEAERCLIVLQLSAECLPNGDHQWTLTNSNDFALDFQWSSTSGDGGTGTVNANSTQTFNSDFSSQTVTVKYTYGDVERTIEMQDDVCTAPDLSLAFICGYPSDTTLFWKVTNNNDFAVVFTWNVDGETENGGGSVAANSTVNFETSTGNKTVKLFVLGQQVDQANSGDACLADLTLENECLENGNHQWTVSNSNDFAQLFTWSSTNGASGSDTVPANGSVKFTTNIDGQTVTILYQHDIYPQKSVSVQAEVCEAPNLLLTYICGYPSDTELIWRVRNSHDFDIPFTWDVYGSAENGAGVAAANSDTFFTTSLGNKTVRIFVQGQLVNTKAGGSTCKVDLELDYSCLVTGLHEWTVVNGNSFDQEFDWSSTSGEIGTLTAPANSSVTFITSPDAQTMTITYQNYVHPEKTVTVVGEVCKSPSLELFYECGYPTDANLYWYVTNPYEVNIDFTWEVVGDSESGSGTALAASDTLFTTSTGLKTVKIMVEGYEVASEQGGESCMVKLDLSYNCLSNGTQMWTITNNNKEAQDFTWTSTTGVSGSGSILAGDKYTFKTDNVDQTITLDYQFGPFPAQTTTASGEACKVSTPEPPTTTYSYSSGTCVQWLVFHTMRDGNLEVYRLDGVEGVGNYVLTNLSKSDAIDESPSRSFNNAWVAFQSDRDGNFEIYYTDSNGNQQIRLTDNEANDINAMFSPDNTNIAFQSDRNGNWDLFLVNRVSGVVTQLTDNAADEINPFFSMDKNWLVYQSNQNGNWDVYMLNIATGMEYQVTDSTEDEVDPAWSPTGQKIAFLSPVDGIMQLFVIDIDGQNMVQITDGNGDTANHAWSPDGTRIAYQSVRDGNMDIYSYDLRDGNEYRVTTDENDDIGPTWDCGGINLAYTGYPNGGNPDILQVFWKGGASSHLTNNPAVDKWSEWSPAKETASRND